MNEDDNLVYDIESYWVMDASLTRARQQVFQHNEFKTLYRLVDFNEEIISFNDIARIDQVIDINRKLLPREVKQLMPKLLSIINAERPITMPYKPEKLTLFIELFDETLGVLYFKDDTAEKNVVAIKRFYKLDWDPVLYFIEISPEEYARRHNAYFKKGEDNVDKGPEGN